MPTLTLGRRCGDEPNALYSFLGGGQVGRLCLALLGIRSPGASALVTEDLQRDIREARLPS